MRIFAYLGVNGVNRVVMKFCIGVGVPDIITRANLGYYRFRGFRGRGGGRISHFFIDLRCRP